jgi:hypothetical protein
MRIRSRWSAALAAALVVVAGGCAMPVLSRDGQLVFQQKGARGASVITANGVEFLDRAEVPQPVVRRSAGDPWRPATGFLMPKDGVWRKTSTPVAVQGHGLAVVLRASDAFVPSWGGEVLLRMDAIAPAAAFPKAAASVRPVERLAIVIDGAGADTVALVDAALEDLGGSDRVGIIDATLARPVLPLLPGSHRTLLHAAAERLIAQAESSRSRDPVARDLAGAIALARGWLSAPSPHDAAPHVKHVLVLTDGAGAARGGARLDREVQGLTAAGVRLTGVATVPLDEGSLAALGPDVEVAGLVSERREMVARAVPPPGDVVLDGVEISVSAVPAPARVIELSGGENALGLYADHLTLGELYVGEARTEVARVALPQWVPGEPLELTVTARYKDVASGHAERATATIKCRYSADVEEIANARHGDVIAYASALAMVRRLHRAFLGSQADRVGGIRRVVRMQATSLADLARTQSDAALGVQAEMLSTLLGVIDD